MTSFAETQAEKNINRFKHNLTELLHGRNRPLPAYTIDVEIRKWRVSEEEGNKALAELGLVREGFTYRQISKEELAALASSIETKFQPPTVIPVKGEIPRARHHPGPKPDSDGQQYRIDPDA